MRSRVGLLALAFGLSSNAWGGEAVLRLEELWPRPMVWDIAAVNDSTVAFLATGLGGALEIGNDWRLSPIWVRALPTNPLGIAANGQALFTGGRDNTILALTHDGKTLTRFSVDGSPRGFAADETSLFFVTGAPSRGVWSYDVGDPANPRLISHIPHLPSKWDLAIDTTSVVVGTEDGIELYARLAGDSLQWIDSDHRGCDTRDLALDPPWLLGSSGIFGSPDCVHGYRLRDGTLEHLRGSTASGHVFEAAKLEITGPLVYASGKPGGVGDGGVAAIRVLGPKSWDVIDFDVAPADDIVLLGDNALVTEDDRDGITLFERDAAGALTERDHLSLPGKMFTFDLSPTLLVSAEGEYGLRWRRHPLSRPHSDGHLPIESEDEVWKLATLIPETALMVAMRFERLVELFELAPEPRRVATAPSTFTRADRGAATDSHIALTGNGEIDLFGLRPGPKLELLTLIEGDDIWARSELDIAEWNAELAIAWPWMDHLRLYTYTEGDTGAVLREAWYLVESSPTDVALLDRTLTVATYEGVQAYDLSNPDSPVPIDSWNDAHENVRAATADSTHTFAATSETLYVLTSPLCEPYRVLDTAPIGSTPVDIRSAQGTDDRTHIFVGMASAGYAHFSLVEGALRPGPGQRGKAPVPMHECEW